MTSYRDHDPDHSEGAVLHRSAQTFFEESAERLPELIAAITEAFDDLQGRFGITVMGTLDDDQIMVGSSLNWPWTAHILAEAPSLEAVVAVCNVVREFSRRGTAFGGTSGSRHVSAGGCSSATAEAAVTRSFR